MYCYLIRIILFSIYLHTFELVQILLSNSILFNIHLLFVYSEVILSMAQINEFICIQLNGFKNSYSTLIILFNITHSFAQLNCFKYCYESLTIQLQH